MENQFKAKLQLRPKNEELFNFVISQLKKNNIQVTKIDELKEGVDVYITSSQFAVALAKLFKKRFKGIVKTSNSLTGEDHYGRIYKLTVLLRLPEQIDL